MVYLFSIQAPGSCLHGEDFAIQDKSRAAAQERATHSVRMTFVGTAHHEATAACIATYPSYSAYHRARDAAYEAGVALVPECASSMCHDEGTIDSGDFGIVCTRCMSRIENTVGT